jgi:hypothetical protein
MQGCLIDLYTQHDFLQESIIINLAKLLEMLKEHKSVGIQALEMIMEQLVVKEAEK